MVAKMFRRFFGSRNDRLLKGYQRRVDEINLLSDEIAQLSDEAIRVEVRGLREKIAAGATVSDHLPRILAIARESMDRHVGIRNIFNPKLPFDPASLPPGMQIVYAQTKAQADALPDIPMPGSGSAELVPGWLRVDIPVPLYEAVRALYPKSRPPFRARPFDVQLIGGMVLSEGRIAEMRTGEGKTIVAPLACFVACLEGLKCYVVTVNDYLVQRDRDWTFPFYLNTGFTIGAIHPFHMQEQSDKQAAYACDVVYGTNSEFGFDYLRDNMKTDKREQCQVRRDFCIIDEVDSILIDEARTPLIIAGAAHNDAPRYALADQLARHLMQKQREWDAADQRVQKTILSIKGFEGEIRNTRESEKIPGYKDQIKSLKEALPNLEADRDRNTQFYEVERERKAAHLTNDGIAEAQRVANIGSFYVGNNIDVPHLLENALRAHAVYQRDRDYVVEEQEVIIVDEFTGRKMIGRQWSDGLHQAVEAKERVKIKEENQTMATVTIQNYFRLFSRLAGMTGTASTEASEFHDVYKLEVVEIPTNVQVVRKDRDDLIYMDEKDKWSAILDEIRQLHDLGRPVLVGTTSVEKSEKLSEMLGRKYGIKHAVLNAKQHEREAQIVAHAGELGAVMIATNMAGRGTDIKLTPVDRKDLIEHWKSREILPRSAKPEDDDEALAKAAYRHMAQQVLDKKRDELREWSDDEIFDALLRRWVENEAWKIPLPKLEWWEKMLPWKWFENPPYLDPEKVKAMGRAELLGVLDQVPNFLYHKLRIFHHTEDMGGLHIVGTERHESRRIDNQLRGRSGRQGDKGSSRFFISLEDDLMQMFANKTMMNALSRLGMKEGDALEHPWLTRSVANAQRKVEERHFQSRKSLLEYDEVMEHQRNAFYGLRQKSLEGKDVDKIILEYIEDAVRDAVEERLAEDYGPQQIAEWIRQKIEVSIEPFKLRSTLLPDLIQTVRYEALDDINATIERELGEYMSHDMPEEDWDIRGLCDWAASRFKVSLSHVEARRQGPEAIAATLKQAAEKLIAEADLTGLAAFLDGQFVQRQLADWVRHKFGFEIDPVSLKDKDQDAVGTAIFERARQAYAEREIRYPVELLRDLIGQIFQVNPNAAATELIRLANGRWDMGLTVDNLVGKQEDQIFGPLMAENEAWLRGDKLGKCVDQAMSVHHDAPALSAWCAQRFGQVVSEADLADAATRREKLVAAGRRSLRAELSLLERTVLLHNLDLAWKDHLYAMDHLRDAVNLRGFAERDPKIEYKREGSHMFQLMHKLVRDRVTEQIFRARLTAEPEQQPMASPYNEAMTVHEPAPDVYTQTVNIPPSPQQQEDMDAAARAGSEPSEPHSRKDRRAAEHQAPGKPHKKPSTRKRKW